MMDRLSDAGYWQRRYETGDDHWDKGAPAPPLVDYLLGNTVVGDVLVPGCGAGHDVRLLAGGGARVLGLDFAPAAIKRARGFLPAGGERYLEADFLDLPDDLRGRFDWVVEHTLFCAIPPSKRADYVKSSRLALRPGGRLLAVFYMNPHDPVPDEPPFGVDKTGLDALFGPWFETLEESVPASAYPGREGRELLRVMRAIA